MSDWGATDHARTRLIDAGPLPGDPSRRLAGVEIELDPNYLTYWRTPGEAGVAPTPDFSRSDNVGAAELRFPAPGRFDEGGAEAFGYKDVVTFPIVVTPKNPALPTTLDLSLSFAVCADLCLPASFSGRLTLAGEGSSPEAGLVRDALAQVPVERRLGEGTELAIDGVSVDASGHVTVAVRAPATTHPSLFVEATDPWYLQAGAATPAGPGQFAVPVAVLTGAKTAARIPVRFTLTTETAAVTVATDLDVVAKTP